MIGLLTKGVAVFQDSDIELELLLALLLTAQEPVVRISRKAALPPNAAMLAIAQSWLECSRSARECGPARAGQWLEEPVGTVVILSREGVGGWLRQIGGGAVKSQSLASPPQRASVPGVCVS